jgi:hypothetical protein
MAATKKPRAFQVQPDKWAQRADAPGEYVADIGGTAPYATGPWIIRQRVAGKPMREWPIIDSAPGAHKSEVEARVAVLNRGNPTRPENISWGRLKKAGARHAPKQKYANHSGLTVTQWIERLYADPKTSAVLRDYAARKASLTAATLRGLLDSVDEAAQFAGGKRRLDHEFTDKLIAAISIDLWEKFGIHRAEEGRLAAYNDPSSWDDGTDPDA